jgi:hypothetical protein
MKIVNDGTYLDEVDDLHMAMEILFVKNRIKHLVQ